MALAPASRILKISATASSAVKVAGGDEPAPGFANDFLGEVLGDELRGAQAKEQSQSQDPSQTENGAGDRPFSDWVRKPGP